MGHYFLIFPWFCAGFPEVVVFGSFLAIDVSICTRNKKTYLLILLYTHPIHYDILIEV